MTGADYRSGPPRPSFAQSGLSGLLKAAAAESPHAALLRDDFERATAGDIGFRVRAMAARLAASGLTEGETILLIATTNVSSIVALAAILAMGAEPALVPPHLGPVELAACARACRAAALVGPSHYGPLPLSETYLSAAAVADRIRVLANLGPEAMEDAIDLSADTLAESDDMLDDSRAEHDTLVTFTGERGSPTPVRHRQTALFADALAFVEQARLNPTVQILSTLPPATKAALVAGPYAGLIGAAGLALHGPFDARRFLVACDAAAETCLVAPAAMGYVFENAQLDQTIGSLALVWRFVDQADFVLPAPLRFARPITDLYAIAEESVLSRRRINGEATAPSRWPGKGLVGRLGLRLNEAQSHPPKWAAEPR
jgi:acyl-CoA synthetase (AMP-forming)/AMP-acid ligase II